MDLGMFCKRLLSNQFLINFFKSLNVVLHQKRLHNIVVGFDTRDPSKSILNLINKI